MAKRAMLSEICAQAVKSLRRDWHRRMADDLAARFDLIDAIANDLAEEVNRRDWDRARIADLVADLKMELR